MIALAAVAVAIVVTLTRPEPTVFNDARILNVVGDPDQVEVIRLVPQPDLTWTEAVALHAKYPTSGRFELSDTDWRSTRTLLLDSASYLRLSEGETISLAFDGLKYRVRAAKRGNVVDYDISLGGVDVFYDGERIYSEVWKGNEGGGLCDRFKQLMPNDINAGAHQPP